MKIQVPAVTHFFTHFRSLGGVQAVLRHHQSNDRRFGLEPSFVIYFEEGDHEAGNVHFLGLDAHNSIAQARSRMGRALENSAPDIAVYHSHWGMPHFVDLIPSRRRILMLHGHMPNMERIVRSRIPLVDGVLCVSRPVRETVHGLFRGLSEDRVKYIPYPISPPALAPKEPLGGRPLVLGYCGRMAFEQKRIDRLPDLCRMLDGCNLEYRFEFLGEGPQLPWLKARLADSAKFVFHGRRTGEDYWRTINQWDAIVFTSEYEGTPIALLEAMATGAFPICPSIGSGGDEYALAVCSDFLYDPGDFQRLARVLAETARKPAGEIGSLRSRSKEAVAPHVGEGYHDVFTGFCHSMLELPAIAAPRGPYRFPLLDHVSFKQLEVLSMLRQRVRALFYRKV